MSSEEPTGISFSETDFEEEKYCGVLAVFGQMALEDNYDAQYDKKYVDNCIGRKVSDTMDLLESTGYLDKHHIASQDEYSFQLPDSDEIRDEAEEIADYINKHYNGKIFRFIDEFDEEDVEKLQFREVGLVYNL